MSTLNHYELLNVQQTATDDEIKQAYRQLSLACHPDKNPDLPTATVDFQKLNDAYSVLMNPIDRSLYDHELSSQPVLTPADLLNVAKSFKSKSFGKKIEKLAKKAAGETADNQLAVSKTAERESCIEGKKASTKNRHPALRVSKAENEYFGYSNDNDDAAETLDDESAVEVEHEPSSLEPMVARAEEAYSSKQNDEEKKPKTASSQSTSTSTLADVSELLESQDQRQSRNSYIVSRVDGMGAQPRLALVTTMHQPILSSTKWSRSTSSYTMIDSTSTEIVTNEWEDVEARAFVWKHNAVEKLLLAEKEIRNPRIAALKELDVNVSVSPAITYGDLWESLL